MKHNQLFFEQQLAKLCLHMLCVALFAAICDERQLLIWVERDCQIAVFNQSTTD